MKKLIFVIMCFLFTPMTAWAGQGTIIVTYNGCHYDKQTAGISVYAPVIWYEAFTHWWSQMR